MNKKMKQNIWVCLVIFSFMMANIPIVSVLGAEKEFSAVVYQVYKQGTENTISPVKDDIVDIIVTIKDRNVTKGQLDKAKKPVTAKKDTDSFEATSSSYGEVYGGIKQYDNNGVVYQLKFSKLKYTGSDDQLVFDLSYGVSGVKARNVVLKVPNCNEFLFNEYTGDRPAIEVTNISFPSKIKAGDTFNLEFSTICNRKDITIKNLVLDYSEVSGGLETTTIVDQKKFPGFKVDEKYKTQITLKAKDKLENDFGTIILEYTYYYLENEFYQNKEYYKANAENKYKTGTSKIKIKIPVIKNTVSTDDSKQAPLLVLDKYDYGKTLKPGTTVKVQGTIKNMSKEVDASNVTILVNPPEGIIPKQASNKVFIEKIKKGESKKVEFTFGIDDNLTTGFKTVDLTMQYQYMNGKERKDKEVTEKLNLPITSSDKQIGKEPLIVLESYDYGDTIVAGNTFTVNAVLKNLSKETDADNVTVLVNGAEGLVSQEASNKVFIDKIKRGTTKTISQTFLVDKSATTGFKNVELTIQYQYDNGKERKDKEVSEKMYISVKSPKKKKGSTATKKRTPAVMISEYKYGGKVPAGKIFTLDMTFKNTSTELPIENVMISLDVAEGLAITSSSNTCYFDNIPENGTVSQSVEMQALPNAKASSTKVTVNFKYEYVDKKERSSVSSSEIISIPVYQPDRMEFVMGELPELMNVGEESNISIQYVNKGKSSIYNLAAEIKGGLTSKDKLQNLGNVESGNSGSIDFYVTPEKAGKVKGTIIITYEDDNLEVKTIKMPYELEAQEVMTEPELDPSLEDMDNEMQEESFWQKNGKKILIGGGSGIALIGSISGLRIMKKKKHQKLLEELEAMDDDN